MDVTDGPLIVQSDKTLLLEVDHPDAPAAARSDRAVRRARALARARPHLPAHPAGAVERARRRARRRAGGRRAGALLPLPGAARAAGRRRRHHGPLRPAASWVNTRRTGWCCSPWTGRCWRRCCGNKKIAPMLGPADRRRHRAGAPVRARPAQAGAAQGRLAGRGPGRLRRRRGAPDRAATRTAGTLRDYQPAAVDGSGPAAPASSCCPAAPARRWSARPRWPRPRPPR